jgi:DMSO reductase anchor subunit
MHPAYSVIFFTTASGLGYGLLVMFGLGAAFDRLPAERWLGFTGLGLALGLITFGLLSSTFHLGHPERAWRAFSQWRSSWLAREGVLAVATYASAAVLGVGWVFFETHGGYWGLAGIASAVLSLVTVYATSMIYASIRAIPRWRHALVPAVYLAFALMTGAVWFNAVVRLFGETEAATPIGAIALLVIGWGLKLRYWRSIDQAPAVSTSGTATGLGHLGEVRLLESPHTSANYLNREMGYKVARKHGEKLRRLALIFGAVFPLTLLIGGLLAPNVLAAVVGVLAGLIMMLGVVIERWLFFAEARHVVNLYYGETAV